MAPKVFLVTGSSSGFGAEYVKEALKRGDKVIATARDVSKLDHLKELGAATMQLDITVSQAELDAKAKEALSIYGGLDVLINNAAYSPFGTLEETSHEEFSAMLNTNLFGPLNVTRSFLPHFREQKAGSLVFMGSTAGWTGMPTLGAYCTAKFGLRGAVESLDQEVKPLGIKTLLVEPGFFRTSLLDGNNAYYVKSSIDDYKPMVEGNYKVFKSYDNKQPGDPAKAAKIVIDIVKGEGIAEGKEMVPWIVLGPDAVDMVKKRCADNLKVLSEYESACSSTNFD